MNACEKNKFDIVKMLIEAFKININQKNNNGWTGFIYACDNNRLKAIELLLEKYPDIINQKDKKGQTGFIHAC